MRLKHYLPDLFRTGRNRGIALIISLGILALVLILVMSFSFDAQSTSQTAQVMNDISKSRLMLRSGVERAMGFISNEMNTRSSGANSDFMNPAVKFYTPPSGNWAGVYVIPSINPDMQDGVDSAFNFVMAGKTAGSSLSYTPTTSINSASGWYAIQAYTFDTATTAAQTDSTIIGRVVTLIIDQTGKVDPAAVVDASENETTAAALGSRNGVLLSEIQLIDALGSTANGTTLTNAFNPSNSKLPVGQSWLSARQAFAATVANQVQADTFIRAVYPYSVRNRDVYWNDINSDSVATDNELVPRFDLTTFANGDAVALYDSLVGNNGTKLGEDPTLWSPWLKAKSPANATEARRIAAQLAIYMQDYVDTEADDGGSSNNYPDAGYVDATTGDLTLSGTADASDNSTHPANSESIVYGMENEVGITDFAVKLEMVYTGGPNYDVALRPFVRFELFAPFDTTAFSEVKVEVSLSATVNGFGNATSVTTGTVTPAPFTLSGGDITSSAHQGGRLYQTVWLPCGAAVSGNNFGDGASGWYIDEMVVNSIKVSCRTADDAPMRTVRRYPCEGGGNTGTVSPDFMLWSDVPSAHRALPGMNGTNNTYALMSTTDPLMADRDYLDADFDAYWTATPTMAPLSGGARPDSDMVTNNGADPTASSFGSHNNKYVSNVSASYTAATDTPYADIAVPADVAFTNFLQLGGIHSPGPFRTSPAYYPAGWNQSVRFWAVDPSHVDNSDAGLLDFFKLGDVNRRSRINVNSRYPSVLKALAAGAGLGTYADQSDEFAKAIINTNGGDSAGVTHPYVSRADLVKATVENNFTAAYRTNSSLADADAESYVAVAAGLSDVRYNYYTVLVKSQTLKDLGAWDLTSPPPANLGAVIWEDHGGTADKYCRVLSESRAIVELCRDAYTGEITILRYEYLEE